MRPEEGGRAGEQDEDQAVRRQAEAAGGGRREGSDVGPGAPLRRRVSDLGDGSGAPTAARTLRSARPGAGGGAPPAR